MKPHFIFSIIDKEPVDNVLTWIGTSKKLNKGWVASLSVTPKEEYTVYSDYFVLLETKTHVIDIVVYIEDGIIEIWPIVTRNIDTKKSFISDLVCLL